MQGNQTYQQDSIQRLLNMWFALVIIGVILTITIPIYANFQNRTMVVSSSGHIIALKTEAITYHAIHGVWPDLISEDELSEILPEYSGSKDINAHFKGDAIQLRFSNNSHPSLVAKTLTIHPATPSKDNLGPIIWVAGPLIKKGWQSIGLDETTLDSTIIERHMQ